MAIQILRDLRGLRVLVVHPPDSERVRLVEHLRRIGCMAETQWPVPESWTGGCDVMLLAVEHDVRRRWPRCERVSPRRGHVIGDR